MGKAGCTAGYNKKHLVVGEPKLEKEGGVVYGRVSASANYRALCCPSTAVI